MDEPDPKYNPRTVLAWSMYDFANSAFATLVITFIYSTYFTKAIAENEIVGTALWSRAVTISAFIVALVSPPLGAVADRGGYRKRFLILSTAATILGTAALYTPLPGETIKALFWFIVANTGYEIGIVFYNAYLPDIAPKNRIGRISGFGWAFGYVGGLLSMGIAMVALIHPETPWFGFTKEAGEHIRATNLLVALWFALFSLPAFFGLRDEKHIAPDPKEILLTPYRHLLQTYKEITQYREIFKLLAARLIYNDGLVTLFAFGGIFAAGTFGFTFPELMVFGIVLNITAGLGAFAFGYLDDRLGGKRTIQISLIGFLVAVGLSTFAPGRSLFWVACIVLGIFVGPNQAASRSLLGRFIPPEKENEFYGFYAFSGKATAFFGPLLLGAITEWTGSQRLGMATTALFFILGGLILNTVNEKEGVRAAHRNSGG